MPRAIRAWPGLPALALVAWAACGDDQGSESTTSTSSSSVSSSSTASSSSAGSGGEGGTEPVGIFCNPVTNAECGPIDGESACDIVGSEGFKCYPRGNTAHGCEACDQANEIFCTGGFTCIGVDVCAKYCCDDGDCALGGTCMKMMGTEPMFAQAPGLGLCTPGLGMGGGGGAGGSACAPNPPPSNGACVTLDR